jgi:hypothetical protein
VKIKQGTTKVAHINTKDMVLTLFKELDKLSKQVSKMIKEEPKGLVLAFSEKVIDVKGGFSVSH